MISTIEDMPEVKKLRTALGKVRGEKTALAQQARALRAQKIALAADEEALFVQLEAAKAAWVEALRRVPNDRGVVLNEVDAKGVAAQALAAIEAAGG